MSTPVNISGFKLTDIHHADPDPLNWRAIVRQHVIDHASRIEREMLYGPAPSDGLSNTTEGDITVHTGTTRQLSNLLHQQRRLEERIAQLTEQVETYGTEDPYDVGSILVWDKTFRTGTRRTYSYAALKTPVGWYVTGRTQTAGLGWFALIDFIVEDALHLPVLYCVSELVEHEPI